MRRDHAGATWITVAGLAASASAQTVFPESAEPNDTKAQATVAAGMVHGDRLTGLTRGNVVGGGVGSPDYFLVSTAPLPLAIYRHQLDLISTPVSGITSSLRGLDQNALRQILAGTDVQIASGVVSPGTVISSTWYGFGRAEKVFFRIQGLSTSPAYTLALSTVPVTPSPITPAFIAGDITILVEGTFGNPDAELWLYDANLKPIAGATNDDPVTPLSSLDRASVTRTLQPGAYYLVVGVANIANHLASPADEATPADDDAMDFEGALVPAGGVPVSRFGDLTIMDASGAVIIPQVPLATTGRWFRFDVGTSCTPATIVAGPASASVCATQSITMSAAAAGTEPIGYQWKFNGQDIPGATGPSYNIASVNFGHAGEYSVTASNACGAATSGAATLTVHPFEPDILAQPASQAACIGGTVSFGVVASGHMGGVLSYQWRHDGVAIPWAHGPVYEFTAAAADAGAYDCIVSEQGCGWAQSMPAQLSFFEDPPRIKLNGSETVIVNAPIQQYVELGAVAADDCDASVPVRIGGDSVLSGVPGHYIVAYDATDSQGLAAATVYRYVTVADAQRPTVQASVTKAMLWPPNHRLVGVGLSVQASDSVDAAVSGASARVRVFCDEAELSGTGDGTGMHSPDAKAIKSGTLRLRAERSGSGDGRVYLIMSTAEDASGNVGFAFRAVVVPHDASAASIAAAQAQAGGLLARAQALATTATTEKAVADGLLAAGLVEHGGAAVHGPLQ